MKYLVALDIGGTHIRCAIAPLDNISKDSIIKIKEETSKTDKFAISSQIIRIVNSLLSQNNLRKEDIQSINIATAGPLDVEKGIVFNNANLGFKEIPIKKPIIQAFPGIKCNMINDANGAVLGVHYFEALEEEKDNLVYITMSTGIGGGVIANGHLVLGKDGNAAEVGHGTISDKENKCNCGATGCWESFSAGSGLSKQVADLGMNWSNKELYEKAKEGEPNAKRIVDQATHYSTIGIGLINNFYDPEAVYIGGAITNNADMFLPTIRENFEKHTIKFTINRPPKIKLTQFRDEIGLLGALALGKYILDKNKIVM